ncbi:MAG: class I tRNA ligase family protein [Rickettsiales bacterium]|nr:class I tRNA ligase family protein [Rickettsiales bacterium]
MTMTKLYPETSSSPNFPEIEKKIQKFWQESNIFQKSVDALPKGEAEFSFFDGPPFANGLPHYGHLLTSCVKDLYARYHTMLGERTERVFGWDCHGLPAEMEAEKELGIQGQIAIQEYGIEKFNNTCRTSVMKYTNEWKEYVNRVGRWVDFDNGYKTMDKGYMESVMWAFSELYKKGYIYEGHKVMPYSWACETPLSNFETRLDNAYREKVSKAITVAFELENFESSETPPPVYGGRQGGGQFGGTHSSRNLEAIEKAKELRKNQTDVEKKLWNALRKDQLEGYSFRRQHPVGDYITDFACIEKKLIVELDGGQHNEDSAIEYDNKRTAFLEQAGFRVLRFWNFEVNENLEGIIETILSYLQAPLLTSPRKQGEGYSSIPENSGANKIEKVYILAWTTTPWTLPSNLALAVGKDVNYCLVQKDNVGYILSKNVLKNLAKELGLEENYQPLTINQQELIGLRYKPLFPYFDPNHTANADKKEKLQKQIGENAFTILEGDFVSDSDGTGIVHLAPGFGEEDQRVCQANGICLPENGGIICPVDEAGRFTSEIFDLNAPTLTLPRKREREQEENLPLLAGGDKEGGIILSLKSLNVIADTRKNEDEPYKEDQLKKYGLANLRIVDNLKNRGLLIKQEDYKHNYPHCWRTDTPLIYRAVPSWYVKVTAFKDRMVELNQKINWIPDHVKDGQFGKWLENAHDWAISRNRFWGAPIPIWRSNNPENKKLYVFGSIKEIEDFFGVKVKDLHRPYIDEITKPDPENPKYTIKRVTEVLDCWFESGSMPFAEMHFPHGEKWKGSSRFSYQTLPLLAGGDGGGQKSHLSNNDAPTLTLPRKQGREYSVQFQPADFIVEYSAQTRGWFYTLMVLSTALFDEIPFKNCICHGVILGEPMKNPTTGAMEKQKLSKRLKNYPDPVEVFNTLGADAMRWMMISSPVMNGGELTISKSGDDIKEVVRLVLKPIWNAYHFFCLYANSDNIKAEIDFSSENLLDRYIIAKLKNAIEIIKNSLDGYNTATACKAVEDFFEVLNNWYIRRSRERFWSEVEQGLEGENTTPPPVYGGRQGGGQEVLSTNNQQLLTNDAPTPTLPRKREREFNGKLSAYNTLYTCLVTMCQAASPLLPFLTEEIFKGLTGKESVHLEVFPEVSFSPIYNISNLIAYIPAMDLARNVCNAVLAIRSKENIRVRQPLKAILIICNKNVSEEISSSDISSIIREEVNVKEIILQNEFDQYAELKLKINFPILGKRLPDKVKEIIPASKQGKWEKLEDGRIKIAGEILEKEECELQLEPKDKKGAASLSTNDALVILDLEITEELKQEGIARDVVRLIQQARKEADLDISNRIDLSLSVPESYKNAVAANSNYIQEQTLAVSLDLSGKKYDRFNNSYEIEKDKIEISFAVAG